MKRTILVAALALAGSALAQSQAVVVAGTVPDEATRQAILAKVREVYGSERVVDQLGIAPVAVPPNWSGYVQKLIGPELKQVGHGRLSINGNTVELEGEVGSEAQRQQLAGGMSAQLNPTYTVRNALRVAAGEQALLDATLANRIVEFESGSATLTPRGRAILDEMAAALKNLPAQRRIQLIGHTDNLGSRDTNLALAEARAEAVKAYLAGRGVAAAALETSGAGPDQPLVSNATAEGRARNRRIEFRVSQQ